VRTNFQLWLAVILFACTLAAVRAATWKVTDELPRPPISQTLILAQATLQPIGEQSNHSVASVDPALSSQSANGVRAEEAPPSSLPWVITLIVLLAAGIGALFHKMSKES
jgi:hypothetical protein